MQARILGHMVDLTPLDVKRGVFSCDLSALGLGSDCVVKRQRMVSAKGEQFSTPSGMTQAVDFWLLQYVMGTAGDRVQKQLAPDGFDNRGNPTGTCGQVMPLWVSSGAGRSQDVMLFKGARYCTRKDYEEGQRIAQSNRASYAQSRARGSAMGQLAAEITAGVTAHLAHAQPAAPAPSTKTTSTQK
jgi:hypothetical protein